MVLSIKVSGLRFWGFGFRTKGSGVRDLRFWIWMWGLGLKSQGRGFGVCLWGLGVGISAWSTNNSQGQGRESRTGSCPANVLDGVRIGCPIIGFVGLGLRAWSF